MLAAESGAVSLTARHETDGEYAGHGAAIATLESGGRGYFRMSVDPGASPPIEIELISVAAVPQASDAHLPSLRAAPSPFAATTRFMFELASAGDVRIDVFDVAGRRVRQLVNGRFEAGSHEVDWDGLGEAGRSMGAGLFFVRLQAADTIRVARCVRVAP